MRLILLKKVNFNGQTLQPGALITVENAMPLLRRGIARSLTSEEARGIVKEYADEADRLFNRR